MSTTPDRFRVLVVAAHPVQYSSPVFRLMAQHPQLDFQVAYCSLRGAEPAHDPEFGRTVQWDIPLLDGYKWTHVRNRGSGDESFFGLYNPGLWRLIREGFDAVICHTGYLRASFWIAYFAAKFSRAAFLFGTDAVTLAPLDRRSWKRAVKGLVWPLLFRLADQVLVPSSGTRELMRSLRIRDERITLTPYVVDNDWWLAQSARVDRVAVRRTWNVSPDQTVVLFCAKLQPWKRPFDLLEAFAKANLPNALLVFAGDGPLHSQIEARSAALGISERVRFLGFINQTQLPAVYTAADLLVLPSEYDAFGVVVNEAMLCGCSVATSDRVGAARDLIRPVSREFIFPCGDVAGITALLARFAADRRTAESLRARNLARLREWDPPRNVAATLDAIQRAIFHVRGREMPAIHESRLATSTSSMSDTSQR